MVVVVHFTLQPLFPTLDHYFPKLGTFTLAAMTGSPNMLSFVLKIIILKRKVSSTFQSWGGLRAVNWFWLEGKSATA